MTTTLLELKPAQIKPHKHNPRRDVGDVTELAESLRTQGVVEPLIVAPNPDSDTYVLLAGHRRLAAARKARLKSVPCLVREDLVDEHAQIELMLVENLQRSDLTPIEEAEAYQQLLAFPGYTQAKIAAATGRAIATVRGRLKMAKLPKSALAKIHEGQISLTEAQALTDFDGDRRFKRLEQAAGTDNFVHELERARRERNVERKVAKLTRDLTAAEVRIVDAPTWNVSVKRLFGDDDVEAHRGCEGFAAYISTQYYGPPNVVYICDKPELHEDEAVTERTERDLAQEKLKAALAEDATVRRTWLRDEVLAQVSDGLALDMLRQHVLKNLEYSPDWIAEVVGFTTGDKKSKSRRIDELTLQQLAIVLDFADHANGDRSLEGVHGWEDASYSGGKQWRARLAGPYGYTWTDHEQQMLDAAAAATAKPANEDEDEDDEPSDADEDA